MILIDAIYINNSGAKVLLDYLIEQLELSKLNVFYLLDERVKKKHPDINLSENKVHYLKASFTKRHFFYLNNVNLFKSVLCFGNIPPSIDLKKKTYTYFHQTLYLQKSGNESFKKSLLLVLKSNALQFYKKNTNKWLVQSDIVKKDLVQKFDLSFNDVLVFPFYPLLPNFKNYVKLKSRNSFLFVSDGNSHKNHINLLRSFENIYRKNLFPELHLTVSDNYPALLKDIESLSNAGYPVINHSFVSRDKIAELYQKTEYCIYPSLRESFGLGLVEAMESNVKVIASDLPYVHAVCKPSLVFDPHSVESIEHAIQTTITEKIPDTVQLVYNQIDELIALLKN